jgi:hypothetical protein
MKAILKSIGTIFFLFSVQAICPVLSQEVTFQMLHVLDLPPKLNPDLSPSCSIEFREEWIIDPEGFSISKKVESFELPCEDSATAITLPRGEIRIRNFSFEFVFLDLPEKEAKDIQVAFLALISKRYSIPDVYDPSDQLLSVYFHEEWIIEPGHELFRKKVRGITPVIWQRRQTANGEPLPDAETGYPVFYKHSLDRIDLRQP